MEGVAKVEKLDKDFLRDIKARTVKVTSSGRDGSPSVHVGHGILLNREGHVLTAGHVLRYSPSHIGIEGIYRLGNQTIERYKVVGISEYLEHQDLAVIQADFNDSNMTSQLIIPKQDSFSLGTPLQLITIIEPGDKPLLLVQNGKIIPCPYLGFYTLAKKQEFLTSHKSKGGDSGAPIFNLGN